MLNYINRHFGPRSVDPDIYRKELVLNSLLGFCFCLIIIFQSLAFAQEVRDKSQIGWVRFILIAAPFLASYYFSRTNKITLASSIFIATFSAGTFYAMMHWGMILPAALFSLVLTTILTGILISSRAGFIYAGCAGIILFLSLTLFNHHIVEPDLSWTNRKLIPADAIEVLTFLLFISGLSWISNRQTTLSLKRARSSEQQLTLERDQLEVTVINRTKALEQAQIDKISELYTFIEFGKLSAGLIHDLMSPLSALCIELETNPNLKSSMNHLVSSSRKIQDMIRATRRQIQINLKKEIFSIRDMIVETAALHNHRLLKRNIIFKSKLPHNIQLYGYPSLFSHIITNLISNSIDACEEACDYYNPKEYRPQIQVDMQTDRGNLSIIIKDNGIGIRPETAEHIFNPFFSTKDQRGCGYGLSASKHMAQKYFQGDLRLIKYEKTGQNHKHRKTNQFRAAFELSLPLIQQT